MQKLKSKRNIIIIAVVCVLLVAIVIGITVSYLSDNKDAENIFSVGDVRLSLVEQNYPQKPSERVMYSNSIIPKDPMIINTGDNPEYVYMLVTLPIEKVTLLDENGQKFSDTPQDNEIFNLISNAENTLIENNISYDNNWIFLGTYTNTNTYIFAYNKVLAKSEKTSTLFDKIQLKSFIEGETDENAVENIGIKACGIQSDNLMGVDLPTDTDTLEELKTKLKSIYNICARQNGQVVIE
ncbi:MAG: hypothetical protein ACI4M3_05140 [Acutalibacteraceae bacterium]